MREAATMMVALVLGTSLPAWAASAPVPGIVLAADGLAVGSRHARFAVTTRAEAIALVGVVLGKPIAQGSHGDCGQGDIIGYAKFRGNFELSFVRGKLSGWTADGASPQTARGIGVGATLAALRKAYPDVDADPGDEANGGLGPSFQTGIGPAGWLDGTRPGSKVTGMFAGATCLAGV